MLQLSYLLNHHIHENKLGELYGDVDTIFGEFDVRRPDLIYFSKDRLHLIGEKAMEGPPDLCVEIISPSSSVIDRKEKFKQYEKGKVAHYWIVDPKLKTIEGFSLIGGKYRSTGRAKNKESIKLPPFESLEIKLSEIWQPR